MRLATHQAVKIESQYWRACTSVLLIINLFSYRYYLMSLIISLIILLLHKSMAIMIVNVDSLIGSQLYYSQIILWLITHYINALPCDRWLLKIRSMVPKKFWPTTFSF